MSSWIRRSAGRDDISIPRNHYSKLPRSAEPRWGGRRWPWGSTRQSWLPGSYCGNVRVRLSPATAEGTGCREISFTHFLIRPLSRKGKMPSRLRKIEDRVLIQWGPDVARLHWVPRFSRLAQPGAVGVEWGAHVLASVQVRLRIRTRL